MITIYNLHQEDHTVNPNNFYIGRGSPVGNLFTHIKTKGSYYDVIEVDTREEAIKMYKEVQFPFQYKNDKTFRDYIDSIYEKYKNGEDIYLGCFCHPLPCHGEVIKEYLEKRLIKERMKNDKKD